MSLSTNLIATATNLIDKYGNTVTLATTTNDGVYNPQTGSYGTPVSESHDKKAYVKPATNEELESSGLPNTEWGDVSFVATMVIDTETARLDNTWTIDGQTVRKIVKTEAQDNVIVIKAYCG